MFPRRASIQVADVKSLQMLWVPLFGGGLPPRCITLCKICILLGICSLRIVFTCRNRQLNKTLLECFAASSCFGPKCASFIHKLNGIIKLLLISSVFE